MSRVRYDLSINYPSYEPPTRYDFIRPFAIAAYDDEHMLADGSIIKFYDTVNNTHLVFNHNNQDALNNFLISNDTGRLVLDSSFNNNIKYWYFENITLEEFITVVFYLTGNSNKSISIPFIWNCIGCKTGITLLQKEIPPTLVNAMSFMADDRNVALFFVRRKDLADHPVRIIEDIFDYADYFNKNFYVDTGLGMSKYMSQLQVDTIHSFLTNRNYIMFGAINAPLNTKVNTNPVVLPNIMNIFYTAGYMIKVSKRQTALLTDQLYTSNSFNMGKMIMSMVPASMLYFNKVYDLYLLDRPYVSIINRNLGYIDGGVDITYPYKTQVFKDWVKSSRINPIIFKEGDNFLFLADNLTPYNIGRYNPLQEEHWARLSVDVSHYLKYLLKNIIGLSVEMEKLKIEDNIRWVRQVLYEEVFSKANIGFNDFYLTYEFIENNTKLKVELLVYLPGTIKEIVLSVVVL